MPYRYILEASRDYSELSIFDQSLMAYSHRRLVHAASRPTEQITRYPVTQVASYATREVGRAAAFAMAG